MISFYYYLVLRVLKNCYLHGLIGSTILLIGAVDLGFNCMYFSLTLIKYGHTFATVLSLLIIIF